MLSCKDVSEQASEYIDGKMPFLKRMQMRLHLAVCAHCRSFMSQMKRTIRVVGLSRPAAPTEQEIEAQAEKLIRELKKEQT